MSWSFEIPTAPLPSVADRFSHIHEKIGLIKKEIDGRTSVDLATDKLSCVAMERMFEIIGIATDHIPDEIKIHEAGVDWSAVSAMSDRLGDVLVRVEPDVLLHWARDLMPPLEQCAARRRSSQ